MVRACFVLVFAACAAPPDEPESPAPDGGMVQLDPPEQSIAPGPGDTPVCGPPELCARSIGECAVEMAQADCESWYHDAEATGGCADIRGYTTCNCDCYTEDTCDAYFACGEICYLDFCQG